MLLYSDFRAVFFFFFFGQRYLYQSLLLIVISLHPVSCRCTALGSGDVMAEEMEQPSNDLQCEEDPEVSVLLHCAAWQGLLRSQVQVELSER